jgi:TonB family protein
VDPTPYARRKLPRIHLLTADKITSPPKKTSAPVLVVSREAATPTARREHPAQTPQVPLAASQLDLPSSSPAVPPLPVKTNVFYTGSATTPIVTKTPQLVQTGGFGDPNGLPPQSGNRPANLAQLGAFDLPSGQEKGNGSRGKDGLSGAIANAGFGSGIAAGDTSGAAPHAGSVRQAGFGAAAVSTATLPRRSSNPQQAVVPAEILSKPNPLYTDEARNLHIEGEVLLQVVFQPSGRIEVLRVVRSLGHGLDEAAIDAAQHIRFRPAMRDGKPAESTGVLHVVFQLA